MRKKNLIIPIEIKNREIDGAVCLASEALKMGWRVIIGQKQQIWPFVKSFPNSFFFLKSIVPSDKQQLELIKNSNHLVSSLDIEGLVLGKEPLGIVRRFSKKTIKLSDIIFYWGNYQYHRVEKIFPEVKKKSYITGSPIIDNWKISNKKKLSNKNNKVILVSMNFARSDPKLSKVKYLVEKKTLGNLKLTKEQSNIFNSEYKLKKVSFKKFIEMTEFLAKKFENYKIVVRPHPEENVERYNFLKKYSNVLVDNKSDRITQLKESSIFIHFNSTMSVQAKYFNNKVIMYNPIRNKNLLNVLSPVPKNLSFEVKNLKQLSKIIKSKKKINSKLNLENLLHNVKSKKNSSQLIMENLDLLLKKNNKKINSDIGKINDFRAFFDFTKFNIKVVIAYLLSYLSIFIPSLRSTFSNRRYHFYMYKVKWPGLLQTELRNIFKKVNNSNKFSKKIKIKKHYSGFFIIE